MQAQWERQLLSLAGPIQNPAARPFFSYWAGDAALRIAYQRAEMITAQHSKSFYFASHFLPEEKRSAVRALYAFCRIVDDIVDGFAAKDRTFELEYWREIVKSGHAPEGDLIAAAWTDTLARYHIPRHYALQLIDGVSRDLTQNRYQTFDELATYCYGVASTVGLMSMYIVGFRSQAAVGYAIKLGVAMQMTNILRDVGEDLRSGRIYLPREELIFYGIHESELAEGRITDRWREFMRFQIERTRGLYLEAWKGIRLLEVDGQLAISAASDLYSGILDQIERQDYDVFSRRASLSTLEKVRRVPAVWWRLKGR